MSTTNNTTSGLTTLLNEIKQLIQEIKQELDELKQYVES